MRDDRIDDSMLDAVVADRAATEPDAPARWAAIKLAQDVCAARVRGGLTQAEVARRMGLPQPRIADIERRPWSASLGRIMAYAQAVGVEVGVLNPQA